MKLELPKRSDITDNSLDILKKQITYILPEYEEKYQKLYEIYLYENHLRVIVNHKLYLITIISLNKENYWYIATSKTYFLIKVNRNTNFKYILTLLRKL